MRKIKIINQNNELEFIDINEFINFHRERNFSKKNDYSFLLFLRKKLFIYCERCSNIRCLQIHHIDKNRSNNNIDNLLCLCKACHRNEHSIHKSIHNFKQR